AGRLKELADDVIKLEDQIRNGDIPDSEVPGRVAELARTIQEASSEFPANVRQELTGPDFDPTTVRAREQASVADPEGFAKIESSLGELASPLPRALEGAYEVADGRLVPIKDGYPPLDIIDGRVEVA